MRTLIILGCSIMQLCIFNLPLIAQDAIARVNISEINTKHVNVGYDKAERNFIKEFSKVYNPRWVEKEDGFRAKFVEDGISYMVDYDRKGNWLNTISNYSEDHLDSHIANAVKMAFLGYAIVHVTEIKKGKAVIYLVKIDNQKLLKTIRVENGEMDVYESYIKS